MSWTRCSGVRSTTGREGLNGGQEGVVAGAAGVVVVVGVCGGGGALGRLSLAMLGCAAFLYSVLCTRMVADSTSVPKASSSTSPCQSRTGSGAHCGGIIEVEWLPGTRKKLDTQRQLSIFPATCDGHSSPEKWPEVYSVHETRDVNFHDLTVQVWRIAGLWGGLPVFIRLLQASGAPQQTLN